MTAERTTPMHPSLATALAAFQRGLPHVGKGATGQVGQNRNYKYADLSDVVGVVLPKLGEHGLSFSCKPTLNASGRFVLAYVLRHESGDEDCGEYPLPADGTPQQMGSAQTYAKRYVLLAITGVAPDEDDDGQAAEQAHRQYPAVQRPDQPTSPADQARARLRQACTEHGWDLRQVASIWAAEHPVPLGEVLDPEQIDRFRESLSDQVIKPPATNGAAL